MDPNCHLCRRERASISCKCTERPGLFCENCLAMHIISQKSLKHVTEQIVFQAAEIERVIRCSVCETNQAQIICLCKGMKTRLCHGCIPFHMNRHPKSPHPMEQLQADEMIDEQGSSLQEYLERKQIVDYLVTEARSNLNKIAEFRHKTTDAYRTLKDLLIEQEQKSISDIAAAESFIEGVIDHLESTRYVRHLEESDWAHTLVMKANPANLSLFSNELKMVKLQLNWTRQPKQFAPCAIDCGQRPHQERRSHSRLQGPEQANCSCLTHSLAPSTSTPCRICTCEKSLGGL